MNVLGLFVCLTFLLIQCQVTKESSDLQTQEEYIQHEQEWKEYKAKHNKQYSEEEDLKRKQKYIQKKSIIDDHNAAYKQGKVSYEMEANQWTDQDPEEFQHLRGFIQPEGVLNNSRRVTEINLINYSLPNKVDWRDQSAVSKIKDQGQCGSCWAFSAVGAIESQYYLKTKQMELLSEQQLIDCSSKNNGCKGGIYTYAFDYMQDNGGLDTESDYRYKSYEGNCRGGSSVKFVINGYKRLNTENEMKSYVANKGPISVAIDATLNLQSYKAGVFDDDFCNDELNHAVLIIGYGTTEDGKDYWLVKNSWGVNWGEKGYFKIIRNKNRCGIANIPVFPVLISAATRGALLGLPIIIPILHMILNQVF